VNERKIVVTGIVGVLLLLLVAILGVALLGGRGSAPGPQGGAVLPPAEPQTPLPPLTPDPSILPAAAPAAPEPAATAPPRSAVPAAVPRPAGMTGAAPWDSVETALRPAGLGIELAAPVSDGLADMRERLQPCFDEEAQRLARGAPVAPPPGVYGPGVLVLRLEAGDGKLVVADTEVASQGTSSPQLVACCRRMAKSHEFAAPVAPPRRYKVQMLLQ
jgi:hypothetical protein